MTLRSTTAAMALTLFTALRVSADEYPARQQALYDLAVAGTKCEVIPNNGTRCTYKIVTLLFAIKDVGGTDTTIAFSHSDSDEEHYALMYFGCVAIAPGKGFRLKHDRNYGVFISPVTGKVCMSQNDCKAASRT